jgi:hypothetical protein
VSVVLTKLPELPELPNPKGLAAEKLSLFCAEAWVPEDDEALPPPDPPWAGLAVF